MDEQQLINSILAGNKDSYKPIVEQYQSMVFRVCMGFVHSKEDADDLTQEVFINAFLGMKSFNRQSMLSTWLYRIAINTSLNHLRKANKRSIFQRLNNFSGQNILSSENASAHKADSADQQLINLETTSRIKKAIDSLSDKQRIAFVLSKYEEMPQQQIAEIMNTSVGAVEQLLQRAKTNLQKQLADYYK